MKKTNFIFTFFTCVSMCALAQSQQVKLNSICCPCEQYDCRPARRNCQNVMLGLNLISTSQVALTSKIRQAEPADKCGNPNGGYILESEAMIHL